jgi:hypothetical protein
MTVIGHNGTPGQPLTRLVTDDIDGMGNDIVGAVKTVWTGDHYLVAANVARPVGEPDIVTLTVDRQGVPLRDGLTLSQDAGDFNGGLQLARDRAALSWLGPPEADGQHVYLHWLDLDGEPLHPGAIRLEFPPDHDPLGSVFAAPLAWTGEMLTVGGSADAENTNEWWLWRVLPDGEVLDPEGVLLSDRPRLAGFDELHWAGGDLWATGRLKEPTEWVRGRIVCECVDADGDGFNACVADCDDTNWQAYPGATELCRGGVDEDCDGLFDCEDESCHEGPGPGPVGGLLWTGSGWAWNETPAAEVYDLTRGLMSDALRRGDFRQAECSGRDLAVPEWTDDGRAPPVGDALWYLVRAEGAPCATSDWGTASSGEPRTARDCL